MKKHSESLFALLLSAVLPLTSLCACGNSNSGAPEETAAGSSETQTESSETDKRKSAVSSLPEDLNFDGETFRILIRSEDPFCDEFSGDQQGEILSDALDARNLKTEETLGVSLEIEKTIGNWPNGGEYVSKIRNIVSSGDSAYNAFAGYAAALNPVGGEGLFCNLLDVANLELDSPWWNQSIAEEFSVGGKLYFLAGELTTSLTGNSIVFFFNKELAENYAVPDLYQLVLDGNWTLDRLVEISELVSSDINGDGVYDENDLYGLGLPMNSQIDAFNASFDMPITGRSDDGSITLVYDVSKASSVLEKLNSLIYGTNSAYSPSSFEDSVSAQLRTMFASGQFLFHPNTVGSVSTTDMRDMKADFGIIPYPKYDETQDSYVTYAWDQYSLLCVPKTCPNVDMTGAVFEELGCETYRSLTEIYFEQVLKDKYSRDDDSYQMLDIIISDIDINFGYLNTGAVFLLRNLVKQNSSDIASAYASKQSEYSESLNKIEKQYSEIN